MVVKPNKDIYTMEETLIDFLLYLNEKGLINNHDFEYEKEVKKFIKNVKKRKKEMHKLRKD